MAVEDDAGDAQVRADRRDLPRGSSEAVARPDRLAQQPGGDLAEAFEHRDERVVRHTADGNVQQAGGDQTVRDTRDRLQPAGARGQLADDRDPHSTIGQLAASQPRGALEHRALCAGHAPEARVRRARRQHRGAERAVHGAGADEHAAVDRGGEVEQPCGIQRDHVAGVDERGQLAAEAGEVELAVGGEHVANLPPGRVHIVLLVGADHLGAEPALGALAWVEVELAEPAGPLGRDGVLAHVPLAVQRRPDGLRVRVGALLDVAGGRVEHRLQRRAYGGGDVVEARAGGLLVLGPRGHQGALQREDRARVPRAQPRQGRVGRADEHRPAADPRRHRPRSQAAGERLEVSVGAGVELPVEVHRQDDRGGRARAGGPRRARGVGVRHRLPEPDEPAHLERRHQAGKPVTVRLQPPRAQQPRDVEVGPTGELLRQRAAGAVVERLGVRPRPRLGQVR